jgi:hypothetical protein
LTDQAEKLANALDALANSIASAPRTVIGRRVSVTAGPGNPGRVIGKRMRVIGGPEGGTTIGEKIEVSAGRPDPTSELVGEIKQAAKTVQDGRAPKLWIESLLTRARALTDRTVNAAAVEAVKEGIKAVFS